MFLLDIFKKKKYKHRILTIDGGGLKGYFAAYSF
jgi:patatin-like phospholipase/acyl hydrolase